MHLANKILVKNSVKFCAEAQNNRNKVFYNPENYKVFFIKWHEQVGEMILRENRDEMKRYLQAQGISTERCDASHIRGWIQDALDMQKRVKEGRVNNIRRYSAVN